jgi:pimeloyl-ACP methyl ester carboxylesterase
VTCYGTSSKLTILAAGHFAWEQVPDQFAAIVAASVRSQPS